jgi:predicted metal-dependent hydrolase
VRLFAPRYADGQALDLGGLTVRLRVSARARRISLRVDRARGEAVAVAPSAGRLADAAAFARERQAWLAQRLAERPAPAPALEPGVQVVVFGAPWVLEPDGRLPRLTEAAAGGARRLLGCGAGVVDPQLVVRAVRRAAAETFDARAAVHCAALARPAPPITLNDARTRWGSCTPASPGRPASIRLSWRLALAPLEVADYVIAHECAHLIEANHGPRFWALVRGLVGDARGHRAWLRRHGAALHAALPRSQA